MLLSEVFGIGKFHKVGFVEEVSTGRHWRLQSDEGASLGGANRAPAPLFQWLAGLQADVAFRILEDARSRSVPLAYLNGGVSQSLAAKGSFARGEAAALVYGLDWDFDIRSPVSETMIQDIVETALRSSPAVAAMRDARDGLFALHTNGQPTPLDGLDAWDAPTVVDPRARHGAVPQPDDESAALIYTFVDGEGRSPEGHAKVASMNASDLPVGFYVDARGEVDLERGLIRVSTGTPEISSDRWVILIDNQGQVAPTPLAMFAMGAAFCYHTQLSRYARVRRLDLADSSLAQLTVYPSANSSSEPAVATEILTHMFLNGNVTPDDTRSLLKVAANTCYAHRAMSVEIAMTMDISAQTTFKNE